MKKTTIALIAFVLIIFTIIIVNMNNSFDEELEEYRREFDKEMSSEPKARVVTKVNTKLTDNEAAIAAQQFVESQLKVPSSADFDPLFKSKITQDGEKYTVVGYVESENSFGAKIRSKYVTIIKRNSTGGVSLLGIAIE